MPLNEHARLPDQDPQPASSSNIYTFYEALGENFEQTLSEYVAQIKKEQDARRGVTQDH